MSHLHAILATRSPDAILIKRGPGGRSCTIGWSRRTDSFAVGQWLSKELHPASCDLSPDGRYFLSFVQTHPWDRPNHVYRAISLAPWLKAVTFWGSPPRGFGPGAGLFVQGSDGVLRLRASRVAPDWDHARLEVVTGFPTAWASFVQDSLFFVRLQRDGWRATTAWEPCPERELRDRGPWRLRGRPHRLVLERDLPLGWRLRQTHWTGLHDLPNRGVSWASFALVSPAGEVDERLAWEWADHDGHRPRVVWTEDSVLYGAALSSAGLGRPGVLLDTRAMAFERRQAPY